MSSKKLIAKARKALRLSTTELSYRLGVSQSTVVRMEQSEARGVISLQTLARAAAALGYRLEYQFVPVGKVRSKSSYHGLRRLGQGTDIRRASGVAEGMREEENAINESLTVTERIVRACELSDYQRKLCFKKY